VSLTEYICEFYLYLREESKGIPEYDRQAAIINIWVLFFPGSKNRIYEQYREHAGRAKGREHSSLLRACPARAIMAKVVILLQLKSTFLFLAAE